MKKIKLQTVVDEIESASEIYTCFYDMETGETVAIFDPDFAGSKEENEELAELIDSQPGRFIRFPTQFEIHEYSIMEDFMFSLKPGIVQQRLARALRGKGSFRYFKDTIADFDIEDSWYSFRANAYREIAIRWCKDNGLEIE